MRLSISFALLISAPTFAVSQEALTAPSASIDHQLAFQATRRCAARFQRRTRRRYHPNHGEPSGDRRIPAHELRCVLSRHGNHQAL